jgi:HEAT repeat protein
VTPSEPSQPPPPSSPTGTSPTPPPTTGDPGGGERPKGKTAIGADSWVYWWTHNDAEILRLKERIYAIHRSGAGSPLGQVGGGAGNATDALRPTEKENRTVVVPALLRVLAEARRSGARPFPDTEGAAHLALARVTEDPAHAAGFLEAATATGPAAPAQMVRESAALAIGLLRRTAEGKRFDAKVYDRARADAFAIFEDDTLPIRTRAFAAISIGLLGDAPTAWGGGAPDGGGTAPEDAARRLFSLLGARYASADLPIALLAALSLQPPTSVTAEMQDALEDAAWRGRLLGKDAHPLVQAWATHALGRVAAPARARRLLNALSSRALPVDVRRCAAIAVGRAALRADAEDRVVLADGLWKALDASKDGLTRAFATMSLARLFAEEARRGAHDLLLARDGKVAKGLVTLATDGPHGLRSYGALALGLVLRETGEHPDEEWTKWSVEARAALREGFGARGSDGRQRGAFAVGLGLAREDTSLKALVETLADRREDHELRGWCATGIGLVGMPSAEAVAAIRRALLERSSQELRLQCATALGLLGARDAVDLLVAELVAADDPGVQGPIVVALSRVGDARAIPPLVAILEDANASDSFRAMACAGLGLVGDLEPLPALVRLSADVNYAAATDAIREFLTIL